MFYTYCNIGRRATIIINVIIITTTTINAILEKKGECTLKIHSVVVNTQQFQPFDVTVHKTRDGILNAEYTISEKLRAVSFFT